jgi:hypothetical protein
MGASSVERFGEGVRKLFKENRMVVFLCGPSLDYADQNPGAALRRRLKDALEAENFEVVLGEDDGLEDIRLTETGGYAHDNELEFIRRECGAIVLVADSVGSFCELGLFVHWLANNPDRMCDLILLADARYVGNKSYFNEGPASAAEHFGRALYVDFATADIAPVLARLKGRRSTHIFAGRGRPAGGA